MKEFKTDPTWKSMKQFLTVENYDIIRWTQKLNGTANIQTHIQQMKRETEINKNCARSICGGSSMMAGKQWSKTKQRKKDPVETEEENRRLDEYLKMRHVKTQRALMILTRIPKRLLILFTRRPHIGGSDKGHHRIRISDRLWLKT
ncbi:Uncharacterized protein ACO02O_02626 [Dirofilaria immitis]